MRQLSPATAAHVQAPVSPATAGAYVQSPTSPAAAHFPASQADPTPYRWVGGYLPATRTVVLLSFLHHLLISTAVALLAGALLAAAAWAEALDFDTSGLPQPPTTFEEQRLWDEVRTARAYPDLAAQAHLKLADYYDRKGLASLATRERSAVGGPAAPAPIQAAPVLAAPALAAAPAPAPAVPAVTGAPRPATPPTTQPATQAAPSLTQAAAQDEPARSVSGAQPPESGLALDPSAFDLSAFPPAATTFEEQLILDSLRDPNTPTNPALLAFAHRQLGRYYAAMGRADLAAGEYSRAVLAAPEDPRGYAGLATLSDAVGAEPGDGVVDLRDVSEQLQAQGIASDDLSEPEPQVAVQQDPGAWQDVSAEFNRRMNYLYTSNAWNNVYRTVFTNLYGR